MLSDQRPELFHIAHNKQQDDDRRQDIQQPRPNHAGKSESFSRICLGNKIFPAPTVPGAAEQQKNQGTRREQRIADQKIFKIEYACSRPERLKALPHVETQNAGQHEQGHGQRVDQGGFFPAPSPHVHAVGNDILHNGNNRCQRGTAHEDKEQTAPQPGRRAWR